MSHQIGSRIPRRDTYVGFCLYHEDQEEEEDQGVMPHGQGVGLGAKTIKKTQTRLKTNLKLTVLNNTKLRHFWAQIGSWAPRHARKTFIVLAPGLDSRTSRSRPGVVAGFLQNATTSYRLWFHYSYGTNVDML